jgi:hypothetical protein
VPTAYGHGDVLGKGSVHEVAIVCGSKVIARQRRSYEPEDMVFDPLHDLALLEQKARALDQAARRWSAGRGRSASPVCGDCWRPGCTRAASASPCRCGA